MSDDGPSDETVLSARDKFKFETFYLIVDKLIVKIEKRKTAYLSLDKKFNLYGEIMKILLLDIIIYRNN